MPPTKGPWEVAELDGHVLRGVVGPDGVLVADVYAGCADDYGLPSEAQYQANAFLIAACPDFVDAARSVLTWAQYISVDARGRKALSKLEAALDKAGVK